jgi:integrase
MGKLSARAVATAKPGRHGDGQGLELVVSETGAKKWVYRYTWNGSRTTAGLGSVSTTTLAQARERAQAARASVAKGIKPGTTKRAQQPAGRSFGNVAALLIAAKEPGWRSAMHAAQYRMTLETYCASIWDKPIGEIDVADVLRILTPLWQKIPESASRLRGRIENVLDYAKARNWRSGENVARWKGGLAHLLPKQSKLARYHFAALPYADVPAFVASLHTGETTARLALEFLILCVGRSIEVRGAVWGEIDLDAAIWVIPARRMKAATDHRVPLTARAVTILQIMEARRCGDLVFPGARRGRPMMPRTLRRLLPPGMTVHGLRSTFRDWAAEQTSFPREVIEQCLAHRTGSAVELAYKRSDLLERRRQLMQSWADFCGGSAVENVVSIVVGKR